MKLLKKTGALALTLAMVFSSLYSAGPAVAKEQQASDGAAVIKEEEVKHSDDASDFVLLSEAVPDAILEIRYYSTYNFVGARVDGYEEPVALLTKEAATALKGVSDSLMEKGYRLKIYDAYRPQKAVDHFVRWAEDTGDTKMKEYFYPELDKSVLFPLGYIDRKSGHSRGSTVDLTLFDMKTEKEVDMGGTFDYFGEKSHPDYRGADLTETQYNNRMILREAMIAGGFKPLVEEWWHFTLENEPYPDTYFTFPVNSVVAGMSDADTQLSIVDVASPKWVTKLAAAKKTDQLVVVAAEQKKSTAAWLTYHKKINGKWRMLMTTPCFIGKNGLGKKKEGDLKTPTGTYKFNCAFGNNADPGSVIPYTKATEFTYWSGDPKYKYNQLIADCREHKKLDISKCDEHIVEYPLHYQYALNISYNAKGKAGKGSAIFLHCFGPGKPWTGGCVAIPAYLMKYLITRVDKKTKIVINTIDKLGGDWPASVLE